MRNSHATDIARRPSRAAWFPVWPGAWIGPQARVLRRLARMGRSRRLLPEHLTIGRDGEREALFHLRRQGYTVVARRWRDPRLRGDLDLIAWDGGARGRDLKFGATLCFIEVKTRSRRDAVPAEMAVDDDKQRTLRRLAHSYIRRLPEAARQAPVRFDVVSVYLDAASGGDTSPNFVLNKGAFQ